MLADIAPDETRKRIFTLLDFLSDNYFRTTAVVHESDLTDLNKKNTHVEEIFKKREKTKNNAQFRRKRLPKGILPCISRFNSICLHKTLVHIISIDKWNQGVYPPVKIGIIWLQTNIA